VMIQVRDSGLGMPDHVKEKAFEPFFTTKDVGDGSGLGLSMVYGFVKQSGGDVVILSEPGAGATVEIYLPRVVVSANAESEREAEELSAGQRERILVVEDEPAVRKLVVTLLEDLGYEVFQAADGPEALAAIDRLDSLRLVLSDMALPGGMSGYRVLSEARRVHPGIETLLMSGFAAGLPARDEGHADGEATEVLHKPFRRAELSRKVRSLLEADP
jgi:CheY-like chemotaxis protein